MPDTTVPLGFPEPPQGSSHSDIIFTNMTPEEQAAVNNGQTPKTNSMIRRVVSGVSEQIPSAIAPVIETATKTAVGSKMKTVKEFFAYPLALGMFWLLFNDGREGRREDREEMQRQTAAVVTNLQDHIKNNREELKDLTIKYDEVRKENIIIGEKYWERRQTEAEERVKERTERNRHMDKAYEVLDKTCKTMEQNTDAVKELTKGLKAIIPPAKAKTSSGPIPLPREKDE